MYILFGVQFHISKKFKNLNGNVIINSELDLFLLCKLYINNKVGVQSHTVNFQMELI